MGREQGIASRPRVKPKRQGVIVCENSGVEIDWILETRGHDHLAELVVKLREKKIRVQTFENV